MIPFFGIGANQLADSCVGDLGKDANTKFRGGDGTGNSIYNTCKLTCFQCNWRTNLQCMLLPDWAVWTVTMVEGLPSPTDVFAVT